MKLINAIDAEFRKHAKVVEIIERRTRKLRREYLVRWDGVEGLLSWETRHAIRNSAMVDRFDKIWDQKLREEQIRRIDKTFNREFVKEEQYRDSWCNSCLSYIRD